VIMILVGLPGLIPKALLEFAPAARLAAAFLYLSFSFSFEGDFHQVTAAPQANLPRKSRR
jgi:hypothetical protein